MWDLNHNCVRVPSPLVPAPGVGQIGQGLQNTWGLEDEDEDEAMVIEEQPKTQLSQGGNN